MAEQPNPGPDPAAPPDPTGDTPPATDEQGAGNGNPTNPPSGGQDDDQVTLSKDDYQKLISQRDKNFEANRTNEDRLADLELANAQHEKDAFVNTFIRDNKKDYPDVDSEDLQAATSPEEVEAIAKRVQGKADKIKEDARKELTTVGQPKMTQEDRTNRLADAEKNHDLESAIEAKMPDDWN